MPTNTLYCVTHISVALKKVTKIQGLSLEDSNVFLTIRPLQLTETTTQLEWNGQMSEEQTQVPGNRCTLIQPEVGENGGLVFSRSLMTDLGLTYQLREPSALNVPSTASPSSVKCKVCGKAVPLKNIRIHVGKHVLFSQLPRYPCGYCGMEGCSIVLNKTKKDNEDVIQLQLLR